jgi:hypothetical protein
MLVTKSGKKLEEVIKKAIDDHVITQAEYEEIINLAHNDGALDLHEKALLKEFHSLLSEKVIKRVHK